MEGLGSEYASLELDMIVIAENASGGDVLDLIGDVDPTDEELDIGMGDSTGVLASLGGEIFSGGKKCQESNISGGEIDSEDKRSLVKSSEESGEMFPGVTRE
ncbi:hypothetical protein Tco_0484534 [Tanacetum coccineum]